MGKVGGTDWADGLERRINCRNGLVGRIRVEG